MAELNRILVAVDGSPHGERALETAIELAKATQGTLTLMTVVPEPSVWMLGGSYAVPINVEELREPLERQYRSMLDDAAKEVPEGIPHTTVLAHGVAGPEILQQLRAGDHDVIVMGSRGRGRVSAAVLGSVSNHVMHESDVPVIVIHRPSGDDEPDLAA